MVPGTPNWSQTRAACPGGLPQESLYFCSRGVDYRFTQASPYPGNVVSEPGIYAVLVPDENCQPAPLRVLYFGQAADLSTCLTTENPRYKDWLRKARSRPLLVSVCALPAKLTEQESRDLKNGFVAAYRPICNFW